jgi:hypothetical protein
VKSANACPSLHGSESSARVKQSTYRQGVGGIEIALDGKCCCTNIHVSGFCTCREQTGGGARGRRDGDGVAPSHVGAGIIYTHTSLIVTARQKTERISP